MFRCDPDGKNLEVVARGLRNPQELAFDEFGNLFADDNNCDKGDHARLVYVVEGGDSGWNMAYQTIPPPYLVGPWHAERMWHLPHAGQPAWIVPPVGKLGAGPSGLLSAVRVSAKRTGAGSGTNKPSPEAADAGPVTYPNTSTTACPPLWENSWTVRFAPSGTMAWVATVSPGPVTLVFDVAGRAPGGNTVQ